MHKVLTKIQASLGKMLKDAPSAHPNPPGFDERPIAEYCMGAGMTRRQQKISWSVYQESDLPSEDKRRHRSTGAVSGVHRPPLHPVLHLFPSPKFGPAVAPAARTPAPAPAPARAAAASRTGTTAPPADKKRRATTPLPLPQYARSYTAPSRALVCVAGMCEGGAVAVDGDGMCNACASALVLTVPKQRETLKRLHTAIAYALASVGITAVAEGTTAVGARCYGAPLPWSETGTLAACMPDSSQRRSALEFLSTTGYSAQTTNVLGEEQIVVRSSPSDSTYVVLRLVPEAVPTAGDALIAYGSASFKLAAPLPTSTHAVSAAGDICEISTQVLETQRAPLVQRQRTTVPFTGSVKVQLIYSPAAPQVGNAQWPDVTDPTRTVTFCMERVSAADRNAAQISPVFAARSVERLTTAMPSMIGSGYINLYETDPYLYVTVRDSSSMVMAFANVKFFDVYVKQTEALALRADSHGSKSYEKIVRSTHAGFTRVLFVDSLASSPLFRGAGKRILSNLIQWGSSMVTQTRRVVVALEAASSDLLPVYDAMGLGLSQPVATERFMHVELAASGGQIYDCAPLSNFTTADVDSSADLRKKFFLPFAKAEKAYRQFYDKLASKSGGAQVSDAEGAAGALAALYADFHGYLTTALSPSASTITSKVKALPVSSIRAFLEAHWKLVVKEFPDFSGVDASTVYAKFQALFPAACTRAVTQLPRGIALAPKPSARVPAPAPPAHASAPAPAPAPAASAASVSSGDTSYTSSADDDL